MANEATGSRIARTPKFSKLSVEPMFQKDAVLLSGPNRLSMNHVEALLCRTCKRVTMEYED